MLDGPAYARHCADAAARAGAEIRAGATVTGWAPTAARGHALTLTGPDGIATVQAAAVLLATGCRERPRPARLVPGARVPGIMTSGELQQRVYLHGQRLPGRAVIVGAEHVSFSALLTLAHAGARVTALVTEHPAQQSYRAFAAAARLRWRVPVWTHTSVRQVLGAREPTEAGPPPGGPDAAGRRPGRSAGAGSAGAGSGWTALNWPTSGPGQPGSARATGSSSPATGFPTTNWPGSAAWRSTRGLAGPQWTRPWRPAHRWCSRPGT